jgi:hypothetical protein
MARIAKITPKPPKAGTKADKPQAMSQMLSNNMPMFRVIFMAITLSLL